MKKRLLFLMALIASLSAWAQTAQLLRDMEIIQEFSGSSALKDAITAAAAKGDIIVLSSGNFSNPGVITKSVSIYGKGMENSSAINGERTYISGKLEYRLTSEGALDGIHIEGLYIEDDLNILTSIGTSAVVDDFKVIKCHSGGVFFYQKSTNVLLQNCKFDRDVRCYPSAYTTTLQMDNCYVEGNLFNFADGSDVTVNHSLLHNNWLQNYSGAYKYNDCVIYKNILSGASANKCIFTESSVSGSTTDCWMGLSNSEIYVADGEDGTYNENKDFTVKDEFVGSDNTLVGLQGGIGWNKTPSMPGELEQDEDGNYLIGSVDDWKAFARIVAETPTANAKMIADVNLGEDQTHIGSNDANAYYSGVFDGQGHTLTVAYVSNNYVAPFVQIKDATIKNLHVDGSIQTTVGPVGGVAALAHGEEYISNVWVSANITRTGSANDWSCAAVIVAYVNSPSVSIIDCLFTGEINVSGKQNGCFLGYDGYQNLGTTTNCLSTGMFNYSSTASAGFFGTYVNTYIKQFKIGYNTNTIPEEMQCTDEQIADGTIATALQAGRTEEVWVQDEESGMPMLKIFVRNCDVDGDGIVTSSDVTALYNYLLNGDETYIATSDVDGDGSITVADITTIYNIILGSK